MLNTRKSIGHILVKIFKSLVFFFFLYWAVIGAYKLSTLVYLPKVKRNIIVSMMEGFQKGERVKLENFYKGEWDEVCFVPSYSFGILGPPERYRPYLGKSTYHWSYMPDPLGIYYGLGFTFLKNKKLVMFISIPKGQYEFFKNDEILSRRPIIIEYRSPENPEKLSKFYFGELNTTYQDNGKVCYPRSTAFLELIGEQHIYVGG